MNDVVDLPVYDTAGTRLGGSKIVRGRVTLGGGVGSVTLTGAAAFASATSYHVTAVGNLGTGDVSAVRTSGSAIAFASSSLDGNDVVDFIAVGI